MGRVRPISPLLCTIFLSGLGACQDLDQVRARMADLGADDWSVREAATEDLTRMVVEDPTGEVDREIVGGLDSNDPEVATRCRIIHAVEEDQHLKIVVLEVQGEADFQSAPKTPWRTVRSGVEIPRGARLCTGVESHVVLAVGSYGKIVVQEASALEIRSLTVEWYGVTGTLRIDPGVVRFVEGDDPRFFANLRVETSRLTASVR